MGKLGGGDLSPESSWEIELADGKLKLKAKFEGAGGGAELVGFIDKAYFLTKIKEKIPGKIDDMLIDLLDNAFGVAKK